MSHPCLSVASHLTSISQKNGGVFVQFEYEPGDNALQDIEASVRAAASKQNGFRTWLSFVGYKHANVWIVKGQPWLEVR